MEDEKCCGPSRFVRQPWGTGVRPMPDLARLIGLDLQGVQGEGVCAAVAYGENEQAMEEEFYGVKISNQVPYYGPQGLVAKESLPQRRG